MHNGLKAAIQGNLGTWVMMVKTRVLTPHVVTSIYMRNYLERMSQVGVATYGRHATTCYCVMFGRTVMLRASDETYMIRFFRITY
jgi:hypothetical protein